MSPSPPLMSQNATDTLSRHLGHPEQNRDVPGICSHLSTLVQGNLDTPTWVTKKLPKIHLKNIFWQFVSLFSLLVGQRGLLNNSSSVFQLILDINFSKLTLFFFIFFGVSSVKFWGCLQPQPKLLRKSPVSNQYETFVNLPMHA